MKKISFLYLLLVLPSFFTGCVKSRILPNPAYAIGTIVSYQESNIDNPSIIGYTFLVAGEEQRNYYTDGGSGGGETWTVPTSGDFQTGDMYMVQYDAGCNHSSCNNVGASRMLFDYPVKDSADYNNFVAKFAVMPPKP